MKIWRLLALVLAAFVLCGCLPVTSKNPVGSTISQGADKALYGTWVGRNPDDKNAKDGFVHFMAAKDGSMSVAMVMAEGGSDDGWTIFRLSTAKLNQNHYLNAVLTFDKDEAASGKLKGATIPVLYTLKDGVLTLYLLDEDKAKAAIKAGKIKGTIEPGDSGDAVITDEPAELDAFFAKPDAAALFKPLLVLKRVE